jgi:hypothetical protein
MDSEGRVRSLQQWADELTEEQLQAKIASGELREVDESEMTLAQVERMQQQIQPVVHPNDQRSLLARKRNEIKRVEKAKIAKRRAKNKAAKIARRKNR